jgi:ribosome biogenesis GTPase
MPLTPLGYDQHFTERFAELGLEDCQPARVIWQSAYDYVVAASSGELDAGITGKIRASERPAVGDWVAVRPEKDGTATILAILPRKSAFSRKAAGKATYKQVVAANVDTVFIVAGLDGELNLRRVERYVTLVYNSGASPVVVLNKSDLAENLDQAVLDVEGVAPGIPVLTMSAMEPPSVQELTAHVGAGQTAAFLGSSGVGKSTLVNALLGEERMATGEVRDADSKGRHTTTHRELVLLPHGGAVIDTPGMREIQVWGDEEGLRGAFPDVSELAAGCKFRDCRHEDEPGCQVRQAVKDGELDGDRLESYSKLRREFENLESRMAETARREERRAGKRFAKMVKEVNTYNPKRRKR